MEDENGAENLEDGELWLPPDFFSMDDQNVVDDKITTTTPLHYSSSSRPFTLFTPLPSLQRFKPALCCGFAHDLCICEARNRWTGFSPVHQLPRMNHPVQDQVIDGFMGERYWAIQKQLLLNRVLTGVGMSARGGTGVFLPRTSSTNIPTAIVAKNYNHHRVIRNWDSVSSIKTRFNSLLTRS